MKRTLRTDSRVTQIFASLFQRNVFRSNSVPLLAAMQRTLAFKNDMIGWDTEDGLPPQVATSNRTAQLSLEHSSTFPQIGKMRINQPTAPHTRRSYESLPERPTFREAAVVL